MSRNRNLWKTCDSLPLRNLRSLRKWWRLERDINPKADVQERVMVVRQYFSTHLNKNPWAATSRIKNQRTELTVPQALQWCALYGLINPSTSTLGTRQVSWRLPIQIPRPLRFFRCSPPFPLLSPHSMCRCGFRLFIRPIRGCNSRGWHRWHRESCVGW